MGRGAPRGAGGEEAVSVKAAHVARRPISQFLIANTTLESIRKVSIYAKVSALVERILVEEGSSVEKGQVLVELDDREIRNEYDQAAIALDQAILTLEQAGVRAKLSEAEYLRSKDLLEQRLISPQEYDQTALNNETDALGLRVSQQQKEAAAARLAAAKLQLDYTEIRSPIQGVITARMIEVGGLVNVNQETFSVEDFSPLWARIFVPERELPQIKMGQQATLRLQAYPDKDFRGRIQMINPTVDPESGTVKVTLEVAKNGSLLRPGMFGTVYIATETRPRALVIPKRAVLRERDENRVFIVTDESVVSKRDVTIGFSEDNNVEVVAGLEEGEAVVTVGQEGLSEGYPVTVLEWEDGPDGTARPAAAERAGGAATSPRQTRTGPASDRSGPATQAGGSGRRPQAGGRPGGRMDPERMKGFLTSMAARNPAVKAAYEAQLEKDPDFLDDPEKLRAFMQQIRSEFGRGRP